MKRLHLIIYIALLAATIIHLVPTPLLAQLPAQPSQPAQAEQRATLPLFPMPRPLTLLTADASAPTAPSTLAARSSSAPTAPSTLAARSSRADSVPGGFAAESFPSRSVPGGISAGVAIDATLYATLRHRLDSLTALPLLQTTQLGLMVYDLTADTTIYSHGARQLMRPASTMKLLTAITALDLLGDDHFLCTSLYYSGTLADGTLQGDLICCGNMNPQFADADLKAFVDSLRALGVATIKGRIVMDRSFKEEELLGEGWCWDDDNPVLSPLLLNREDNLGEQLLACLRRAGISVEGGLLQRLVPGFSTGSPSQRKSHLHLVCNSSQHIDQILKKMMKDSDNLYAEAVFYQIAAHGSQPARAKEGRAAVRRLISRIGLQPQQYRIADGSGLSLYNYVSAELETKMLRYAYRHPKIFSRLHPTLPVATIDGTLKSRMAGTRAAGNVHAKTGTVTGISSLAGYCTAANGHELAFCIINQGVMRAADGKNFQDAVCKALCEP